MKLVLNKEYAGRHLFVTLLMVGLCCWFGYDGFIRYPATPAAELYASIEGSEPPEQMTDEQLEAFKKQKTQTQYGFTILTLFVALVVGSRLAKSARFQFEFDDEGYVSRGRRHAYADIKTVDRSRWEKKGIVVVDGIELDSWHHLGVREFVEKLKSCV